MRHKNSKTIFTYWNNLRGARPAPDRREIEPSDIRDILGDTFILEMDPTYRSVSFRLAGTRLCNAYGRELKGLGFLAVWEETDNLGVFNAIREVHEESRPCAISSIARTEHNRFMEYEMMLLPLQNGDANAKRVLGTASPLKSELWLGSEPLVSNRMKSVRYLDKEIETAAPPMFGALPSNTGNPDSSGRKVGHLKVIDGGLN